MKLLESFLAAAVTTGIAGAASGATLVYESFEFADVGGVLEGNAGGTGLGTWDNTGNAQTPTGDLTYGSLVTSGSGVQTANLWGRPRVPITVDLSGVLANDSEMWFSIRVAKEPGTLVRIGLAIGDSAAGTNGNLEDEGAGDEQAIGGFLSRNNSTFYSLIWESNPNGTSNLQSSSSPTETTASDIVLSASNDNSVLIVGHAQWGATDLDTDTLTLYAPSESDPTTLGPIRAVSQGVVTQQSFDTLSLATGTNVTSGPQSGIGYFDEIRIGESFEDVVVVPEPASCALLGLGGLLLSTRRRET